MSAAEIEGTSRTSSGVVSPPQKVRSRAPSIASDRPSTTAHSLMSPPLAISPEAAFIATSAASQIVTNDHDSHADAWYDQHGLEPSGETAVVSPAALQLVNNFLDQLLFNFLNLSRATTLTALRPAVSEVLKPKLAKDAINQADEELREYLGGGDDVDIVPFASSARDWDLELVWKRTRLRCMVYSSLGDLEEEDEDYYMEQEHLGAFDEDQFAETVSPAVAIFLTSILEFMGEQALIVAGQAAYHRIRAKYEKDLKEGARSPAEVADRIVVEELDMERVALDRTLGRLWRAWKKRIRSPVAELHSFPRTVSRERLSSTSHGRQASLSVSADSLVPETVLEKILDSKSQHQAIPETTPVEEPEFGPVDAAAIPLPVRDRDLAEILISGLAYYSDDESGEEEEDLPSRPKSMTWPVSTLVQSHVPTSSQPPHTISARPPRRRANSLPTSTSPSYEPQAERNSKDAVQRTAQEPCDDVTSPPALGGTEGRICAPHGDAVLSKAGPVLAKAIPAIQTAFAGPETRLTNVPTRHADIRASLDGESDDFDDNEEPQILTSTRMSVSGRSSSPATSDSGRPLSITPIVPARSGSIHSLRVIEVASPRSPISRSRGSSMDATDCRSGNVSRASSISIQERRKTAELVPNVRSSMISRSPTTESISEAEEVAEPSHILKAAVPPTPETVMTPVIETKAATYPDDDGDGTRTEPIFGSAALRPASSPRSPAKPTTKVTILSSTTSTGTFFLDEPPQVPAKSPQQFRPSSPRLPDRSSSRQQAPAIRSAADTSSARAASGDRPMTRNSSLDSIPAEQSSPTRSMEKPSSVHGYHGTDSSVSSGTKYKTVRASEDNAAARPEDVARSVARSFEELIQSDQTIQYTLTPESMRDIDSTRSLHDGSPLVQTKSRKSEDARHHSDRSRSSSVHRPADLKRAPSVSRSFGLTSHPVHNPQIDMPQGRGRLNGPVPRAPESTPGQGRANGPQARDARVPGDSLADFAEFIRATGPAGQPVRQFADDPSQVNVARSPASPALPPSTSRSSITANRPKYQARDATVDYRDNNSDLIDFIRRGPPSTSNPRIPRTVAPFRTTMDSDQLSAAVGGRAVDATLPPIRNSTTSTSVNAPSAQSSVNSSSALLRSAQSGGHGGAANNMLDSDMPIPQRKTRRVRDPYAIDFSDEEEEDDDLFDRPPRKPQTQEESLIDFLRNVPPPPEPQPTRVEEQMRQIPKKKASAPSLIMARFTRRESRTGTSSKQSADADANTVGQHIRESSRSLNTHPSTSATPRGHVPIQVTMPAGLEKLLPGGGRDRGSGPNSPRHSGAPGQLPGSRSAGRVLMKKYEPRESVGGGGITRSATSDLADFLRNSSPPTGNDVQSMAFADGMRSPTREESGGGGGFSRRMFGARRKKSTLV